MADLETYLANSRFSQFVEPSMVAELAEDFSLTRIEGGEQLFAEGDPGDAFYVVITGRLQVLVPRDGDRVVANELGQGDCFGELALINDQPRAATIKALRDSELAKLTKERFLHILQRHPKAAVALLKIVSGWINNPPDPRQNRGPATISLMPCCKSKSVSRFIDEFRTRAEGKEHILHMTSENLDARYGSEILAQLDDDEKQASLVRWLNDQEAHYDNILLQSDPHDSTWSRLCGRQADLCLYIVSAQMTPDCSSEHLGHAAGSTVTHCELVVVSDDGNRLPTETGRWLEGVEVSGHHHIRLTSEKDYDRLRRHLSGRSVGLVLSGGGARGFAHIGVLRALDELGIPVDSIGGTSMGALIGSQYAAGYSVEEIHENCREAWVRVKAHRDFTFPIVSLIASNRAQKILRKVFSERRLEDLWLPNYCITSDLTAMRSRCHRQGTAWSSLLASGSLPGVSPPIVGEEGTLLVDGGLLNNLPVEAMREHHTGRILAVDVSTTSGIRPRVDFTVPPSGWWFLLRGLLGNRKKIRFPNIIELLLHTTGLSSSLNTRESRKLADLCLEPPTRAGLMQMDLIDGVVDSAYRYALPILREWWEAEQEKQRTARPVQVETKAKAEA